jgi:hypothetical protein
MRHNTYFGWSELKVGDRFRVPGYDDCLQKINDTHAKSMGCGCLGRPIRFARKGETVEMTKADFLILAF